ncbi:MAG: esterase-like activity of phytase family protein [Pseudomonadota bacterium]
MRLFSILSSCLAPAALLALAESGVAQDLTPPGVRVIAEHSIPAGLKIDGVAFGGLSSIERDPETGDFLAVSDDRAERGPARFYRLRLEIEAGRAPAQAITGLEIVGWTELKAKDGWSYPAGAIDPEALRAAPGGGFYLATESDGESGPSVTLLDAEGAFRARLAPPLHHLPSAEAGVRDNQAYEALAVLPDGRIAVGLESALKQDGPAASVDQGALVRVTLYDPETRAAVAEHVYPIDPIAARPIPADGFADAGLVALLANPDGTLFALERSFAVGQGNVVKLYLTTFGGADDVLARASLSDGAAPPRAMAKRLVHSFQAGGAHQRVDNLEGVAFGPEIDGAPTLVFVSDDNFNSGRQVTQFIVLGLD